MHISPADGALRTNAELNLSVLQRHNAQITGVLSTAHHAVIYIFSTESQTWEKTGVEGTLFVCRLGAAQLANDLDIQQEEHFQIMVLNRRGLDNFELEICNADDVEIADEYIILRGIGNKTTNIEKGYNGVGTETPSIYGLWIFAEPAPSSTADSRLKNAAVIHDCAIRAQKSRQSILERNMIASQRSKVWETDRVISTSRSTADLFAQQGHRALISNNLSGSTTSNVNAGYGEPTSRDILGDLFHRARLEHYTNE